MSSFLSGRTSVTFVGPSDIADDAVTLAKLAGGTDGNVITYDASGNPAAVAVGTSGDVLTSNGAGAAPTFQLPASGTDLRLGFLLVAEKAGDRLNMIDGIVDPFKDEGDVDTGTSSNEIYDASGDFYDGKTTPAEGTYAIAHAQSDNDWGKTGSDEEFIGLKFPNSSSGGGTVTSVVINVSELHHHTSAMNAKASLWTDNSGTPGAIVGGESDTVAITSTGEKSFTWSSNAPTLSASTTYWCVLENVDGDDDSVLISQCADQGSNYDSRRGGTETGLGSAGTPTADWRMEINLEVISNVTLASNAFTADSAPATGRIHIQAKPIDSITLNTDLTAEISRNGGTTYTAATLVAKETLADGTIAYEDASVDISSQSSAVAMKWRIKTLNDKDVELHGVVLQWA